MTAEGKHPGSGPRDGAPAPAAATSLEQEFDASSLYSLRAAVAAHAAAAGLDRQRVYDVTAAAHEMAANAVVHGAGRGRLRLWTDGSFLYCQVDDDGRAVPGDGADTPGNGTAPWPVEHGHGLWLIGQVAGQFTVGRGQSGTTATARFLLVKASA